MKIAELDDELQDIRLGLSTQISVIREIRKTESLTDDERLQCAREFFLTGSLSEIARVRGIAYGDLLDMSQSPWWQNELQNLEREANAHLKIRLTKLMGSTLDQLEDRLENGDAKADKEGEVYRIPIAARDLATISNMIMDKKAQIEDRSSGFGSSETRRLLNLAAALTARQVETTEILDATIIEGEI